MVLSGLKQMCTSAGVQHMHMRAVFGYFFSHWTLKVIFESVLLLFHWLFVFFFQLQKLHQKCYTRNRRAGQVFSENWKQYLNQFLLLFYCFFFLLLFSLLFFFLQSLHQKCYTRKDSKAREGSGKWLKGGPPPGGEVASQWLAMHAVWVMQMWTQQARCKEVVGWRYADWQNLTPTQL